MHALAIVPVVFLLSIQADSPIPQPVRFGTISGRVVYSGDVVPQLEPLVKKGTATKDAKVCACEEDIPNESLIVNPKNKGVANVFVYIRRVPRHFRKAPKPDREASFAIRNCRYQPHALIVSTNQTLRVTNHDAISHTCHMFPQKNAQLFQCGIAPSKDLTFKFKKAEGPVKVTCDFHSYMNANVLVVDHPYAAITDENGYFEIPKVPYGTHKFTFWHEAAMNSGFLKRNRRITINRSKQVLADIAYSPLQLKAGHQGFPLRAESKIAKYTAYRTSNPMTIDGKLDEPEWKAIPQSPRFSDIVSGDKAFHDTRAAVMWDTDNLYVAYWIEEPVVQATSNVEQDNNIAFFFAGPDAYYGLKINAAGNTSESMFIWQDNYQRLGFRDMTGLNKSRTGPKYESFNGAVLKNHPRGLRWAFPDWRLPEMNSAVQVQGTLNDDKIRDRGWTVELALSWKGMLPLVNGGKQTFPPKNDDTWRMDFSRFNQYREAPADE